LVMISFWKVILSIWVICLSGWLSLHVRGAAENAYNISSNKYFPVNGYKWESYLIKTVLLRLRNSNNIFLGLYRLSQKYLNFISWFIWLLAVVTILLKPELVTVNNISETNCDMSLQELRYLDCTGNFFWRNLNVNMFETDYKT
jgi:hypothetical protein